MSAQLPDQRSGTSVTARPDEQLAPKSPIFSRLPLCIDVRSRDVASRTGIATPRNAAVIVAAPRRYGKTAMALISISASGEVILLTSTMVEAGGGAGK